MGMAAYTGATTGGSPDHDQILSHFETWFGDCTQGQIDIGWMDPVTGRLNHFKRFGAGDFDQAAEFVAETNTVPGQSVYYRPALVTEDAPTFVTDQHFLTSPGVWCDLDDDGAATNAKNIYSMCKPTTVVVTGRNPWVRAQMYWKFVDMVASADIIKRINTSIAGTMQGDTAVVNPTSLMRVGGTVAWPWKDGRGVEETTVKAQPRRYIMAAVVAAFPVEKKAPADSPAFDMDLGHTSQDYQLRIKNIRAGKELHNNTRDLVAHMVGRGYEIPIIETMCDALLRPVSDGGTIEMVPGLIRSAIEKFGYTPLQPLEKNETDPLMAHALGDITASDIKRRDFLYGTHLIQKYVATTISPGGGSKTTLLLTDAIAMATKRNLVGNHPHKQCKVWHYNLEDPLDELQRRVIAICDHYEIDLSEVKDHIFLNSGRDRKLVVATKTPTGAVIATPDVEKIIEEINKHEITVMQVDPFVKCHQVEENDNKEIDLVMDQWGDIANRTGCAIELPHHVRKPPAGQSVAHGDINQARGASAISGAVRSARTITVMTEKEASALGIKPDMKNWYIRIDDAKANMSPPAANANWLERRSITINNGDEFNEGDSVGILTKWTPPDAFDGMTETIIKRIINEIDIGATDVQRYSFNKNSNRWVGNAIIENALDKTPDIASVIIKAWKASGLLYEDEYENTRSRKDEKGVFVNLDKIPGEVNQT